MSSYDQWKTASPYDDYDDEHCVYCGADLPDDVTGYSDEDENAVSLGYCNTKCETLGSGGEVSPRYGLPAAPTEDQHKQIKALWDHLRKYKCPKPATLAEVSEHFPEGDFIWDDSEPGDAHVWCCGEKDCPVQWHEAYYNTVIERKNGKLSIEIHTGDSDGNWDFDTGWEEGEDWDNSGVGCHFGEYALREYFKGWLEYWLDAAETGLDPLHQLSMRSRSAKDFNWVDACIKPAQSNANALPITPTED
jgi:hypothetical protein